jgi:hypothetical protein
MIIWNRLTVWCARRLGDRIAQSVTRAPDFIIGGAENPYLKRWWLIPRNRLFNIYLHEFIRDDDDRALHDHPWWSMSLALGMITNERKMAFHGYIDEVLPGGHERHIGPGAVTFRGGSSAHRLVVPFPGFRTLFITGPSFRMWGFHCPRGWVDWKTFTGADTNGGDSSRVGRGCGEH